jgi:hypothetical protein
LALYPNGKETNKLNEEDELIDILEVGLPKLWSKQMIVQDFDPTGFIVY